MKTAYAVVRLFSGLFLPFPIDDAFFLLCNGEYGG